MNELDYIVKVAYECLEDEDDIIYDFVGEDDFDKAMYYALSKIKKITNLEGIINYLRKITHISESEAFRKGRSRHCSSSGDNYITCEGYMAFIQEGKYRKHIGIMKNE